VDRKYELTSQTCGYVALYCTETEVHPDIEVEVSTPGAERMVRAKLTCVGGLANEGVQVSVGFARIWIVCESVQVASSPRGLNSPAKEFACGGPIWGPPCESVSDLHESDSFASQCESRVAITEIKYPSLPAYVMCI